MARSQRQAKQQRRAAGIIRKVTTADTHARVLSWLGSYNKVSSWMARYGDVREQINRAGGLLKLQNFLPGEGSADVPHRAAHHSRLKVQQQQLESSAAPHVPCGCPSQPVFLPSCPFANLHINLLTPDFVAEGVLAILEGIQEEEWNSTAAEEDYTHNNISHEARAGCKVWGGMAAQWMAICSACMIVLIRCCLCYPSGAVLEQQRPWAQLQCAGSSAARPHAAATRRAQHLFCGAL